MTAAQEQPVYELKLATAQDFLAALRAPDMGLRLATLSAIYQNPESALAFGAVDGRDLIDELIDILAAEQPSLVRLTAVAALFSLNDQRAFEHACRMFQTETDLEVMLMIGHRIGSETNQVVLEYFLPFLNDTSDRNHQRIAARMLAGRDGLSPYERLQVALLAGESGAQPPRLASDTLQIWLDALQGAFCDDARGFLRVFGEEPFCLLKENWNRLDPAAKAWLLSWGGASFPEQSVDLIITALSEGDRDVQRAAFKSILEYENSEVFQTVLDKIVLDGLDTSWTAAAILAGVPVINHQCRIFNEKDPDVRIALIYSLARKHTAAGNLVKLLEDEDWRIRAAATDVLVSMGDESIDAVSTVLSHENVALRTAASQVLIRLGRADMMQQPC